MHPGKIIAEVLTSKDGCNLSVMEISEHLKVHRATIYRLLTGKAILTTDLAVRLSKLLPGIDLDVWMNLQKNYDIEITKKRRANLQIKPLKTINVENIKNILKKHVNLKF